MTPWRRADFQLAVRLLLADHGLAIPESDGILDPRAAWDHLLAAGAVAARPCSLDADGRNLTVFGEPLDGEFVDWSAVVPGPRSELFVRARRVDAWAWTTPDRTAFTEFPAEIDVGGRLVFPLKIVTNDPPILPRAFVDLHDGERRNLWWDEYVDDPAAGCGYLFGARIL